MNANITRNNKSKSNPENPKKKTTQGRKRIEIKKIKEKNNLQVTFSKRRAGLFKKANELCLLCGAEVSIIAFSPGKKAYVFGHPSVDALLDRYLGGEKEDEDDVSSAEVLRAHADYVHEANRAYEEAVRKLEEEKMRARAIEEGKKVKRDHEDGDDCGGGGNNGGGLFWWMEKVDEMEVDELEEYVKAMQEMRKKVIKKIDELTMMDGLITSLDTHNHYNYNHNYNVDNQVNDLMMEKCFADDKSVGVIDGTFGHNGLSCGRNYS